MEKILIPLFENSVAPRFDLATDVLIVVLDKNSDPPAVGEKVIVLANASSEEMCKLVVTENAQTVIASGIEESYHQFLTWKKVRVIDNVVGPVDKVIQAYQKGTLKEGDFLE